MGVNDALHVRPLLHDAQVERPLAGGLAPLLGVQHPAGHVDGADVLKAHVGLRNLGGGDEDHVFIRAQRQVAALAGDEAQLRQPVGRRSQLLDLALILSLKLVHAHIPHFLCYCCSRFLRISLRYIPSRGIHFRQYATDSLRSSMRS